MASKVLGQIAPAAATYTGSLYNVGTGLSAVVSTLVISNRAATPDTYRIRVAIGNAATDNKQYLAYDVPISSNSSMTWTIGMTLAAGDYVYVGSNGGNCSFTLFGDER